MLSEKAILRSEYFILTLLSRRQTSLKSTHSLSLLFKIKIIINFCYLYQAIQTWCLPFALTNDI